jgi:hypothetical protein
MSMLEDRRNINRFAMAAIAFLFLSFAVETLPDVGPMPFLLTLGAIFFSVLAIAVSWRVNRRAAADSERAAPEGNRAEPAKRRKPGEGR